MYPINRRFADHWLSQWKDSGAAQSIVPLALHVDCWTGEVLQMAELVACH